MDREINLAVYQGQPVKGDVEANFSIVEAVLRECKSNDCDLCVFPELFISGYDVGAEEMELVAAGVDSLIPRLSQIAISNNCAIAMGYPEFSDSKVYNSCVLVSSNGEVLLNYRKTHMWDPDMIHEKKIYTSGNEFPVCDLFVKRVNVSVRVGILICFDAEFPEPSRIMALKGVQLLLIPTALADAADAIFDPIACDKTPTIVIPCRACENHLYVAYANLVGPCSVASNSASSKPAPVFCGQSAIISPDGKVLIRAGNTSPQLIQHTIFSATDVLRYSQHVARNDYLAERRPELYDSLCSTSAVKSNSTGDGTVANANVASGSMETCTLS